MFALCPEDARLLAGYVSSLAIDAEGSTVAVTSSRGAVALVLDIATGRTRAAYRAADVSGIAPMPDDSTFMASTGEGELIGVSPGGGAITLSATPWRWDNHMASLRRRRPA